MHKCDITNRGAIKGRIRMIFVVVDFKNKKFFDDTLIITKEKQENKKIQQTCTFNKIVILSALRPTTSGKLLCNLQTFLILTLCKLTLYN